MDNDNSLMFKHTDDETYILNEAVKLITQAYNVNKINIDNYRRDIKFLHVNQWPGKLRKIRSNKKKEVLTNNYLLSFCNELVGEELQNDPDPKVIRDFSQIQTEGIKDQSSVIEGLLRKIFKDEKFVYKKTAAFRNAVEGGHGVLYVGYDYKDPYSMDKKIFLENIEDPTYTYFDPNCRKKTKSDADYCGLSTVYTKDKFKMLHPKAKSDLGFELLKSYLPTDLQNIWFTDNEITVCTLWKKEYYTDTIVRLSNGQDMVEKEALKLLKDQSKHIIELKKLAAKGMPVDPALLQEIKIIDKRKSNKCYKIYYYKLIADEILEKKEWPSKKMPLIWVDFDSVMIDNIMTTRSFHKYAQDAQKYINYLRSQSCDQIMRMNGAMWLANVEQIDEKIISQWLNPDNEQAILIANADRNGAMPTRFSADEISQSLLTQYQAAIQDIHNILGRYGSNRGQEDNSISAVAINARARYGNLGSMTFLNNLEEAVVQVAEVCLSLLPSVYDTTRPVSIMAKDGSEKNMVINYKKEDGSLENEITRGNYRVSIEGSSSFSAQKSQTVQQLLSLITAVPQMAPGLVDILAQNMESADTSKIINRIVKMTMGYPLPELLSEETGISLPPPKPPTQDPMIALKQQEMQLKAQNEQAKLLNEQQSIKNDELQSHIRTQELINEAIESHQNAVISSKEADTKLREAEIKADAEIKKALIDSNNIHTKEKKYHEEINDNSPNDEE